jgi:F-type H+-transporting ATPase subunit epsilon
MFSSSMSLKILLPYKVFAQHAEVKHIVAMTRYGAFGILANRLDCVMALSASILECELNDTQHIYIAIDEGMLVKTGNRVFISVRNAVTGLDLHQLRRAVNKQFLQQNEQEKILSRVLAKMESRFIRGLTTFNQR